MIRRTFLKRTSERYRYAHTKFLPSTGVLLPNILARAEHVATLHVHAHTEPTGMEQTGAFLALGTTGLSACWPTVCEYYDYILVIEHQWAKQNMVQHT